MNWFAFTVITIATFVLQSTMAWRMEFWGAQPNWMLVVMVFYAMHARPPQSIVAGWLIGLLADCSTIERAGLVSITFGLTATLVTMSRDYVFRFGWISQLLVTAASCAFVQFLWLCYRFVIYGAHESVLRELWRGLILTSLYTGLWAPVLHFVFLRFSKILGIPRPRNVYANSR